MEMEQNRNVVTSAGMTYSQQQPEDPPTKLSLVIHKKRREFYLLFSSIWTFNYLKTFNSSICISELIIMLFLLQPGRGGSSA